MNRAENRNRIVQYFKFLIEHQIDGYVSDAFRRTEAKFWQMNTFVLCYFADSFSNRYRAKAGVSVRTSDVRSSTCSLPQPESSKAARKF